MSINYELEVIWNKLGGWAAMAQSGELYQVIILRTALNDVPEDQPVWQSWFGALSADEVGWLRLWLEIEIDGLEDEAANPPSEILPDVIWGKIGPYWAQYAHSNEVAKYEGMLNRLSEQGPYETERDPNWNRSFGSLTEDEYYWLVEYLEGEIDTLKKDNRAEQES